MIHYIYDKKVPLHLYKQMIDDHILFTNVVSNKNTDFSILHFLGVKFYINYVLRI